MKMVFHDKYMGCGNAIANAGTAYGVLVVS